MTDIEIEDLKSRLEIVEKRLEHIGSGPRGPAGPPGRISTEPGPQGPPGRDGKGIDGRDGKPGRDGRDGVTPDKSTLDSIVIELLHDYQIIAPDGNLGAMLKHEILVALKNLGIIGECVSIKAFDAKSTKV
jgi:hypothetical protein